MKIYFAYQEIGRSILKELEVSESITAEEILELPEIKLFLKDTGHKLKIGVNGEELDGKYKALPVNYRMSNGERLEIYRPLHQDPKSRRKEKAK